MHFLRQNKINLINTEARVFGDLTAVQALATPVQNQLSQKLGGSADALCLLKQAPQLVREGVISGGMIPKVDCCIEAIRRGVKKVFIIDGRVPHSILIETLTDEGIGTMFM